MDDGGSTVGPCGVVRPYHHGDLRRALIEAAERVLQRDGAQALSLRAVAREAGVSPAAPYHHFKDKSELLQALASDGFDRLQDALRATLESDQTGRLSSIGVSYVRFARANPELYRVMYDAARNAQAMPEGGEDKEHEFGVVREAMIRAGADPNNALDLELACVAAWCAAHGVAEMASFTQFRPLVEALGGEEEFVRAVLEHLGHTRQHRG